MLRSITSMAAAFICAVALAQEEPKFAKDAAFLNEDGTTVLIPASFGNMSIAFQVIAPGPAADVRIPCNQTIKVIIRVDDQNVSPIDVIRAFKLTVKGDNRKASMGAYGIRSKALVPFSADVYGESSFVLTFKNLEPGEYGIWYSANEIEKNMAGEHPMTFFGIDPVDE